MRGAAASYLAVLLALLGAAALRFGWPPALAGALFACALGSLYYVLAGAAVVLIFVRAALALLPIGTLAAGIIFAIMQTGFVDETAERAIIAAVVVAAGWVVAFVTGEMRRTTAEQERRRDIIRAALVEVQQILAATTPTDWDEIEKHMQSKLSGRGKYEVFWLYGQQYQVLKRLVEQIEILRKHQIERVMALYQLLDRITEMEARMDLDSFRALPKDRRLGAVSRYIDLQRQVPEAARAAEDALKDSPFWGVLRRLG